MIKGLEDFFSNVSNMIMGVDDESQQEFVEKYAIHTVEITTDEYKIKDAAKVIVKTACRLTAKTIIKHFKKQIIRLRDVIGEKFPLLNKEAVEKMANNIVLKLYELDKLKQLSETTIEIAIEAITDSMEYIGKTSNTSIEQINGIYPFWEKFKRFVSEFDGKYRNLYDDLFLPFLDTQESSNVEVRVYKSLFNNEDLERTEIYAKNGTNIPSSLLNVEEMLKRIVDSYKGINTTNPPVVSRKIKLIRNPKNPKKNTTNTQHVIEAITQSYNHTGPLITRPTE